MQDSPKVSIIIPSFNYGRFLTELLTNLQSQTFQNWEAILVDDGSTDDTQEQAENFCKLEKRISYFKTDNRGNAAARNIGLSHAIGDFIQFLDADDLLSKDKLYLQVEQAIRLEENMITYTDLAYFMDQCPDKLYPDFLMTGKEWMPKFDGGGLEVLEMLVRNNFTAISCPLISRKFILEHNIRFEEGLDSKVDWLFWIECLLANASFRYFGDIRAKTMIRRHDSSITVRQDTLKFGEVNFREKVSSIIEASRLSQENKKKLDILNEQLKKWETLRIIEEVRINNFQGINACLKKLGWKTTLIYLLKHYNYRRKSRKGTL
ncbi:glycosyltransferase family 2 protein [Algoriphagus sp.]|uniref:glycosyltransferase family 2 protein n=1 Tax=Algoriphagus sp. TaxID=1872435 RepID=UPI003F724661